MKATIPLIRGGLKPLRRKPTFFFKVMLILTVHVVVLGGLLLQGCKDTNTEETGLAAPAPSAASPTDAASLDQKPPPVTNIISRNAVASQPLLPPQSPQARPEPPQPVAVAPIGAPADPADTAVYVVKAGDTLGRIARLYRTSPEKIKSLNGLKSNTIKIGQKLKVPGAKTA
jgi:hypothetical protein